MIETDTVVGCGYGTIQGRVCSPNGSDWLSDVEVSVSVESEADGFDYAGATRRPQVAAASGDPW